MISGGDLQRVDNALSTIGRGSFLGVMRRFPGGNGGQKKGHSWRRVVIMYNNGELHRVLDLCMLGKGYSVERL